MNTTMLKLISFLNDLAHDSANGFEEISEWNKMESNKVLYDKSNVDDTGTYAGACALMVIDSFGIQEPRNANTLYPGVKFGVVQLSSGMAIAVDFEDGSHALVNDGRWYFI